MKLRPLYQGRYHERRIPGEWYAVPCQGYCSLAGLASAILFAVNHDRQTKGLPFCTQIDDANLRLMNPIDWRFSSLHECLAFSVVECPPTIWERSFG